MIIDKPSHTTLYMHDRAHPGSSDRCLTDLGGCACRCLGKKYGDSSSRISAAGDLATVMASVTEAVLAQDKLSQDISLVPCSSLVSHHCQVCLPYTNKSCHLPYSKRHYACPSLAGLSATCRHGYPVTQEPSHLTKSSCAADIRLARVPA